MSATEKEKDALRAMMLELHEQAQQSQRQPGEYTIREYAEIVDPSMTHAQVLGELETLEHDGKIKFTQRRKIGGHWCRVFEMVK